MKKLLFVVPVGIMLALLPGHAGFAIDGRSVDRGTQASSNAKRTTFLLTLGAVEKLYSFTNDAVVSTTSTTFVDVPGTVVTDTFSGSLRRGYHVLLTGNCAVDGIGAEEDLEVRILINGIGVAPGASNLCEDATPGVIAERGSAAQWINQNLPAGTYTIKLQFRVPNGGTGLLNDQNFTVTRHTDS